MINNIIKWLEVTDGTLGMRCDGLDLGCEGRGRSKRYSGPSHLQHGSPDERRGASHLYNCPIPKPMYAIGRHMHVHHVQTKKKDWCKTFPAH